MPGGGSPSSTASPASKPPDQGAPAEAGLPTTEASPPPGLSASVKLVIWDLDDTLWTGTLSEGPVTIEPSTAEVVRALNRRGIPSSICSKNDPALVRHRLEEADLWDEFVFASVAWEAKGERVARIVEAAQLRAENVLFVDDLAINREEVRRFVPGIHTAGPELIEHLLTLPELRGKDDRDLSRLRQYRILEQKHADRGSNRNGREAFLASCDIRIGLFEDPAEKLAESERILELVNRTNQLNFTKRRLDADQLSALLADPTRRSGFVRVRDRYGDYGLCGFYALSPDGSSLSDFLFSCRVLDMGVEQWVHEHLGRLEVATTGEVASTLEGSAPWITLDHECFRSTVVSEDEDGGRQGTGEVLIVGGCDLAVIAQFLGGSIRTEVSRTNREGRFVRVHHTDILRQAAEGLSEDQLGVVDRLPFVDRELYDPLLRREDFDVVVYSLLMDYNQVRYRHRETGLVVPWHLHDLDATDHADWPTFSKTLGLKWVDEALLGFLAREFECLGKLSPEELGRNLRRLARDLAPTHLILINGAEVEMPSPELATGAHHREMNAAVDEVVAELANVSLCDVRRLATSPDDMWNNLLHYRRHVFRRMAEEIRTQRAEDLQLVEPEELKRLHRHTPSLWSKLRVYAGRRRRQVLGTGERRVRSGSSPS